MFPPFQPIRRQIFLAAIFLTAAVSTFAQETPVRDPMTAKAEAVVAAAVQKLGGDRYMRVKSQIGKGRYSVIRENALASFQTFLDIISFPDRERTEFKQGGTKSIQVNTGNTGWVFDGEQEIVKVQTEAQVANFKRGIRTSLDYLLRGYWKGEAELSYAGRRAATLGKRNDVVKVTYKDGLEVEFEFAADDATPQRAIYKIVGNDGDETKEEDRYAQFVGVNGILTPFIVDRFSNGSHISRINYESVEFDRQIPESVFAKPSNPKDAKKDVKY